LFTVAVIDGIQDHLQDLSAIFVLRSAALAVRRLTPVFPGGQAFVNQARTSVIERAAARLHRGVPPTVTTYRCAGACETVQEIRQFLLRCFY
jgi:hypothetical protein